MLGPFFLHNGFASFVRESVFPITENRSKTVKTRLAAFACAVAITCLPACALAAPTAAAVKLDPAAVHDARRMMDVMKVRELTMLSMQQMEELIPAQIDAMVKNMVQNDPSLSDEQKQYAMQHIGELTESLARQVRGLFADPVLVDEMVAEMVPMYAQAYTRDEMRQLATFYRSPLGQKMLAATPQLMAGGVEVANRLTLPRMEKLVRKMVDTLSERVPKEEH
jgi:hypothetical protein